MNKHSTIFSNSTEFGIWHSHNCEQCELFTGNYEINKTGCPTLENVLTPIDSDMREEIELKKVIGMNEIGIIGNCILNRTLRKHWIDTVTKPMF